MPESITAKCGRTDLHGAHRTDTPPWWCAGNMAIVEAKFLPELNSQQALRMLHKWGNVIGHDGGKCPGTYWCLDGKVWYARTFNSHRGRLLRVHVQGAAWCRAWVRSHRELNDEQV